MTGGVNPFLATLLAALAGALAGLVTGWLNIRLKLLHLLASILVMTALYSVTLRIMGRPNIALIGDRTVFSPFEPLLPVPPFMVVPIVLAGLLLALKLLLDRFLTSRIGLALRAAGANPRMARAHGVDTDRMTLLCLAISNALVALAGGLFAQSQGAADVSIGIGTIVAGLAAVIGGEALISTRTVPLATLGCLVGALLYRLSIAFALNLDAIGLEARDLNLVTAVLVTLAVITPRLRAEWFGRGARPAPGADR